MNASNKPVAVKYHVHLSKRCVIALHAWAVLLALVGGYAFGSVALFQNDNRQSSHPPTQSKLHVHGQVPTHTIYSSKILDADTCNTRNSISTLLYPHLDEEFKWKDPSGFSVNLVVPSVQLVWSVENLVSRAAQEGSIPLLSVHCQSMKDQKEQTCVGISSSGHVAAAFVQGQLLVDAMVREDTDVAKIVIFFQEQFGATVQWNAYKRGYHKVNKVPLSDTQHNVSTVVVVGPNISFAAVNEKMATSPISQTVVEVAASTVTGS